MPVKSFHIRMRLLARRRTGGDPEVRVEESPGE